MRCVCAYDGTQKVLVIVSVLLVLGNTLHELSGTTAFPPTVSDFQWGRPERH